MDNKTKMGIGALFLASSIGVGVGRLTAAPTPVVRLVGVTIEPVVSLVLSVDGKHKRLQCTDANGVVVKLDGKDFPSGKSLCEATTKFSVGAKASVGMLASEMSK